MSEAKVKRFQEDVVISGISGKFPESENMDELMDNLIGNKDMVCVNDRRWPAGIYGTPKRRGLIKDLTKFDSNYFNVHAKQADSLDPQIRIMLEGTYEALVDAGVNPEDLRGSNTGVYIGASYSEFSELLMADSQSLTGYELPGGAMAMFSNRISYSFDFKGPSLVIDTACSSSMLAFHTAFNAIRSGEIDAAIVGGSQLCLKPSATVEFNLLNMLSPEGACKVFDNSGDGYARSEAIAVLFLQKAKDAKRIYAHVINTGTNCDGNKEQGITYPSGRDQKILTRKVFSEVGLDPKDVAYVEAHGTGTKVGDPEEVNNLTEVFCKDRKTPLLIGSVKSNLGHAEPASGVCALAKVIVAMETGIIPANLHFKQPNKEIPAINDGRLKVVDVNTKWDGGYVAMNSFGFGGSNVHVILKSNQKPKTKSEITPSLVCYSGRTEEAVESFLKYVENMPRDDDFINLLNNVYKRHISGHSYRGYTVIGSEEPVREILEETGKREVWFMFTGMGCQWAGMGRAFMSLEPFANAIRACAAALKPVGVDLLDIIMNANERTFDNILNSFVSITSIQIALVDVLRSMGITPDGIIGHSAGEVACGYADGCLTREQTALAAYYRGKSTQETKLIPGLMAAVGLSYDEAKKRIPPSIYLACHNGEDSVTISGPESDVLEFIEKLKSQNIFAKKVESSNIAFHSAYVNNVAPKLLDSLKKVITMPNKRSSKWLSSSTDDSSTLGSTASAEYYVNNLISPVLFHNPASKIPEGATVIEIGPHAIFQSILKKTTTNCLNIGLVSKFAQNQLTYLLSNFGKLFISGQAPDLTMMRKPSFPVARGTPMIASKIKWDHSQNWSVSHFRRMVGFNSLEYRVKVDTSYEQDSYINGHNIDGRVLFPASGYLHLAWKAFAYMMDKSEIEVPVVFENVYFIRATIMPKDGNVQFLVHVNIISGKFEITEGGALVVTGEISVSSGIEQESVKSQIKYRKQDIKGLEKDEIYRDLRLRGYNYQGLFQGIKSSDNFGKRGVLEWKNNWVSFMDTMLQFSLIGIPTRFLSLPTKILRVTIDPKVHFELTNGKEEISVEMYDEIQVVRSGGVEIRGISTSQTARKTGVQPPPKVEQYKFIPYIDEALSVEDALTVLVQIVLENSQNTLKVIEHSQDASPEILSPSIIKILDMEPMSKSTLTVSFPNLENAKILEPLGLNNGSLEMANLLITNDETAHSFVAEGDFVLKIEDDEKSLEGFDVISRIKTPKGIFQLFRKVSVWTPPQVVEIKKDFGWLDMFKDAMKNAQKVLIVSHEFDSGILGMFNCLKQEPNGEKVNCLFLPKTDEVDYKIQLRKNLRVNIFKDGKWGSMRHFHFDVEGNMKEVADAYINTRTRGDLSSFRWIESPLSYYTPKLKPELDFCTVYYAALNFKDVMLASGKLSMDALSPVQAAMECCIGLEVAGLNRNGERIMACAQPPGFATRAAYYKELSWKIPSKWTMEQAATIPTVYATVYYSFFLRGNLKRGESVLIHAGSGGVGQAAIRVATSMGCEIFTTVGTEQKRQFLLKTFPNLKEENIGNSRDASFEQLIKERTNGRGVDVVLNSLSGELLYASYRCLANYGRFLEIGRYDISKDSKIGLGILSKSVSIFGIYLDFDADDNEQKMVKSKIYAMVKDGIENGVVQPLEATVFPHSQVEQAFRYLATGKHIGKVVLEIRKEEERKLIVEAIPRLYMVPNKSYIVLGGLGGFGLELADWLLQKGAKNIILVSSKGVTTGYQSLCLRRWEEKGFNVTVSVEDTTQFMGAQRLLKDAKNIAPVGGIFNLAVVLRDGMHENLTKEDFNIVYKSKVSTTQNLDAASRKMCPDLDYFVVFSSLACGRGNPGQTNYGYANSAMERICEIRREAGFPAVAIQWGAVGDVGLVVDGLKISNESVIGGTHPQVMSSCLSTLERILQSKPVILSSMVLAERGRKKEQSKTKLEDVVANIFGLRTSKNISDNVTMADLGMDSLMAAEIKQVLERNYDVYLSPPEIRVLTFGKLRELDSSQKTDEKPIEIGKKEKVNLVPDKTVIHMKKGDGKTPWFFIHPIEGSVEPLTEIVNSMEVACDIYGFQCTKDTPLDSIIEISAFYIKVMKNIQPKGPYRITGYSFGSILAFEMAAQLEKEKEKVELVFIDGSPDIVSVYVGLYRRTVKEEANEVDAFIRFMALFDVKVDQTTEDAMRSSKTFESTLSLTVSVLKAKTGYDEHELSAAASSFFKKLAAAESYRPRYKISSQVTLIKAENNFTNFDIVESVNKFCTKKVIVFSIEGDHRTIIKGESGKKIAKIITKL